LKSTKTESVDFERNYNFTNGLYSFLGEMSNQFINTPYFMRSDTNSRLYSRENGEIGGYGLGQKERYQ
jgi:hypothetical protein